MAKEFIDRWISRASNAVTFWTIVPSGFVGLVSGYLASSVGLISQYGAWGWFTAGLLAFFVSSISFGAIARTKLWRIEAKHRARLTGDSSPFDPMATVYENKRLYLRDLAPLGRRYVLGKRFIDCEIIGPGVAMVGITSDPSKPSLMRNSHTLDGVDCIEVDPDPARRSTQAIEFVDCDFDGCKFYHMSLLFSARENETLHWITKDARQALLPKDAAG
ncbi:hypothetical protein GCM10023264_15900 [Sphingomonas daechungensis]|uniref:Uncharacterized protein n=1 Tax=Sphingomonas daechungensis TaxID=1176646 RepID=A0ABX6T2Z0_9SPHN|nr:hypothetical protein [Sphingomonas daechungensis]QNP44164.1 hypothetical protein H9L15_06515 [Sphingomonas daechungensis]